MSEIILRPLVSPGFSFAETSRDGDARTTLLKTPRASIETPVFMPVGTQASVKSQTPDEVSATGARIILANTYHLWLRPGAERIENLGGVQKFMSWPHAMLTDSGGYQVFSLAKLRKIDDHGVAFRSHLNGEAKLLTPEESMRVQALLGSDIAMLLDECPPGAAERSVIEAAMKRTSAWARRSLAAPSAQGQARFGIVQGGTQLDLRLQHLADIASLDVDGIALGGFSVGEPIPDMYRVLAELAPQMPRDRPRYLMGVGTPYDLLAAIGSGVDMFDCVLPTRNARNGQALTWHGRVNLRQARHADDTAPLDPDCGCPVCKTFTRAYLRHMFNAKEMLGPRLLTEHNLWFYGELTQRARKAIRAGRFQKFASEAVLKMRDGDEIKSRVVG
ncbi:MAG: tgt-2 [Myxococcaceae bacterium]|nr:tgt-2 [Myxococcaceae bacterium]